jgi:hypothetical protein
MPWWRQIWGITVIRGYQMAHPNEDLVREGFAAFGRGDMDATGGWNSPTV